MGGLFLFVLWLFCVAAAVAVARIAKPILAGGIAFSSPAPMPLPGRHFGRRLRRWWRSVDLGLWQSCEGRRSAASTRAGHGFAILPIVDVKTARLAGLQLQAHAATAEPNLPPDQRDQAALERAVAYGRKLGWRHSSTTLVVPLEAPASLLGANAAAARLLRRYAGDVVPTVPPLLLLLADPAELERAALLKLIRQLHIGVALRSLEMPTATLPEAVEQLFLPAAAVLAQSQQARELERRGCRIVATGVADTTTLERLAKAGVTLVEGPVLGRPHVLDRGPTTEPAPKR